MSKTFKALNANGLRFLLVILCSVLVLAFLVSSLRDQRKTHEVILAAGNKDGESYILSSALKTVVEARYPNIQITLQETAGTTKNLELLKEGKVDLVTAQGDSSPDATARMVANLFDDVFQLVVRADAGVREFPDLRGKRIALPQHGGQYESFKRVAEHFGSSEKDFTFVGDDDRSADQALKEGRADAVFRVRALGNQSIGDLITHHRFRLAEIGQAAAIRIRWPAYGTALIPAGAYIGNPPIPDRDLPSIAVKRTLLAREDVPEDVVFAITETLMEHHNALSGAIPERVALARSLLAQISEPDSSRGLGPALHPGAEKYFNKDKPSFIHENADYIGLLLTILLLVGSWLWELKHWVERRQKNQSDIYMHRAVDLMNEALQVSDLGRLEAIRSEIYGLLAEAVAALDADRLSEETFQTFRGVLQITQEVTAERVRTVQAARAEPGICPIAPHLSDSLPP